ncbi:related to cellobiose dehydrogenase [Cephalotrichum gorgonifer]|uniref:Related to cellobiose dehydrogenase n=1 Tax=Cephalotrichum gorgonifer TaxID=2041049 RepID=A0AAE8SWB4_9PEZI|nr:related to cellobiose dehydrogenase [Cephalotrichum gorgonifer]
MMLFQLAALAALAAAAPSSLLAARQDTTGLAYKEFSTPSGILYRIAIPEGATAPFDIAFQIVAPVRAGWAGIAWGGSMLNNPLSVAWPNGDTVTVTSRIATDHAPPNAYADSTITVLPGTTTNATHWTLDALCSGCSKWAAGAINPSGSSRLSWAFSSRAVATPANPDSQFAYHDGKGTVPFDFAAAQVAGFEEAVGGAVAEGEEAPATP